MKIKLMCVMDARVILPLIFFFSLNLMAAIPSIDEQFKDTHQSLAQPKYQVSMRVGLKGQTPISFNTIAKSGRKSFLSEISDDGQSETLIEMFTKKSHINSRQGLYMDLTVTKRVRGVKKLSEHTQIFAPDNQELELGQGGRGRAVSKLSLAVVAYKL